jgi:FKBP-type peptidyl-prolyl cis-trans isomerase
MNITKTLLAIAALTLAASASAEETDSLSVATVDTVRVVPRTVTPESQQQYLDQMASQPGAQRLPSGVIFTTIKEGKGTQPTDADKVLVECYSVLSDGSIFYQTEDGQPDEYEVTGVIKGFAEGLKLMHVGGIYRVVIPSELAYGERGIEGVIPGNAALNFTVTLRAAIPK